MVAKKVSIIMGVYNEEERWLRKSIESVLTQTYKNIEFIIILDNPNNTLIKEVIESYVNNDKIIKFYINEKNIGLINTLNKAIDISSGYYIARMDADDIALKERIQTQVDFMELNKEYALVGAKVSYIDEDDKDIFIEDSRVCDYMQIKNYLKYDNAFAHPTIMYKADVVKKLGKYDQALYAEDYDLILRFVVNGYRVCNIDKSLLKYRLRNSGISISKKNYQITTTHYLQKLYCKFIKKNIKYSLDKVYLDKLLSKNDTNLSQKIDNIHKMALKAGDENKKLLKSVYVITLCVISPKYFKWYKNRIIKKIKFK